MSTDRPNRFTDRISELWNDRPRPDRTGARSPDRPSFDNSSDRPPADLAASDRFSDRPSERLSIRPAARFSDLEPLIPVAAPSAPAAPAPGPMLAPDRASSSVSVSAPDSVSSPAPAPRIRAWAPQPSEPTPRAVGSPLPTGSALSSAPSSVPAAAQPVSARATNPAQPGNKLALGRGLPPAETPMDIPSGVQRVVNAVRATLPFIQRILPLLDGNIGTAVSNLMAPPAVAHRPAPPPPPVDLAPLEEGISALQTQHRELRTQIADQNTSLKRVEDQLEAVREATDRNTLEQQELLEDLKSVGTKVNIFAMVALLLLVVSVMVNVILYLHIKRVLP
jgi:hypothetical protein